MADILNVTDHGPFGGMTDQELERLAGELMAQPEYRRKELAALLIHSTLNITKGSVDRLCDTLLQLPKPDPEAYPEG
tara:strand:+ start:653 stop:883 length:231 start_codon:yes stop_codon:yes gene_type:complete